LQRSKGQGQVFEPPRSQINPFLLDDHNTGSWRDIQMAGIWSRHRITMKTRLLGMLGALTLISACGPNRSAGATPRLPNGAGQAAGADMDAVGFYRFPDGLDAVHRRRAGTQTAFQRQRLGPIATDAQTWEQRPRAAWHRQRHMDVGGQSAELPGGTVAVGICPGVEARVDTLVSARGARGNRRWISRPISG
jgi:hypothetical protein